MQIKYHVTKQERKAFVKVIGEFTGFAPVYQGAPSFAYAVGDYIIDRHGTLIYDERTAEEDARRLLRELSEQGFVRDWYDEPTSVAESTHENSGKLAVEVELDGFTKTALENLERLISGKAALIMKAVGADSLPIERTENTLGFAWFPISADGVEVDAYTRFVHALCNMAKTQKRVTMKEKASDGDSSDKFAFRCFLLRLGFIGAEYASSRKILLSKLSGSSAFKNSGESVSAE